jgi:Spy/CpxP family protein refolding chaperone
MTLTDTGERDSIMTDSRNSFSRVRITALLGITLAFSPALAIAAPVEDTAKADALTAIKIEVTGNADDFVGLPFDLTEDERAELKELMDKLDRFWNTWEASDWEGSITDEDWERMSELENKAWRAETKAALSANEAAEIDALWNKLDALRDGEDLTENEWSRLSELEDKAAGGEDVELGVEEDTLPNEEYVKALKGLTDAERAELKALKDKSDAYQVAWDRYYETEGLTDAEWDRMNKLEEKARLAEMANYLPKDEFFELTNLYDRLDRELELTDAEWDRMAEIEEKARLAEMEQRLSKAEYAELIGLHEKLDREGELTDAEWDRYFELEDKGDQDNLGF